MPFPGAEVDFLQFFIRRDGDPMRRRHDFSRFSGAREVAAVKPVKMHVLQKFAQISGLHTAAPVQGDIRRALVPLLRIPVRFAVTGKI